jgi:hypothetical protein
VAQWKEYKVDYLMVVSSSPTSAQILLVRTPPENSAGTDNSVETAAHMAEHFMLH